MTEDLKSRERSIEDILGKDVRRRVSKQARREQSLGAGSGTGAASQVSNMERTSRPANIPQRIEQEDAPRRSSQEPMADIKIANVGQERLNGVISYREEGRSPETSQDPA